MKTFCPFINGECRSDCVFRLEHTVGEENGKTVCQLVTSTAVTERIGDILIEDKQDNK